MRLEASSRDLPALLHPLGTAAQTAALFPDAGLPSPADRPRRVRLSSRWLPSACPRRAAGHGALAASAPSCAPGDELARDTRPSRTQLLPRRGSGPALVLPRILEVASTSTYASLVHSSVRSNRKEGAARRPVGKLTCSQGDLTACACEALANAVTSPGPWASRCLPRGGGPRGRSGGCSGAWGLQCRRLAGVAATAETKHFVLGTWRSRTERGSRTDGRGCRAHIPRRPLPVTLPSTAPAGPPLCPGPPALGAQPPLGPASEKGRQPI